MAYSLLRRTGQFRIADTEKVKYMSSSPDQSTTPHIEAASTVRWQRRFLMALTRSLQAVIEDPASASRFQPVIHFLKHSGISTNSFDGSAQQLLAFLMQNTLFNVLPIVSSVLHLFITGIVIFSLTVYFMIDGYRVNGWLRNKTPVKFRGRINLFMNVVEKSLGSFVRGQVLLAFIMSVIVGVGAYFIGVPYVFLLSVIVFVFEFVPVIGAYISGAIGILFALF